MIDADLSAQIAKAKIDEVVRTGAGAVATACQQCVRTMGAYARRNKIPIDVLDLAQLLLIPKGIESFYRKFLEPVIRVHHRRGKRTAGRAVKVKSGLEWVQRSHKAPGGLMRAEFRVDEGRSLQDVRPAIEALYAGDSIDTPGGTAG